MICDECCFGRFLAVHILSLSLSLPLSLSHLCPFGGACAGNHVLAWGGVPRQGCVCCHATSLLSLSLSCSLYLSLYAYSKYSYSKYWFSNFGKTCYSKYIREYKVFTFQRISGKEPIPQGLQQILMTSFCFGAKEPQRDFGLDPGSWNKNVFFISGQGPIPQGLQQILMTSFFLVLKNPRGILD